MIVRVCVEEDTSPVDEAAPVLRVKEPKEVLLRRGGAEAGDVRPGAGGCPGRGKADARDRELERRGRRRARRCLSHLFRAI